MENLPEFRASALTVIRRNGDVLATVRSTHIAEVIAAALNCYNPTQYEPDLARAFRFGARDLCNCELGDKIDIPEDAAVIEHEGGGGAYVQAWLYVSDGERHKITGEEA